MIWYCDTETVQLYTDTIDKIKPSVHSSHIDKRLELSKEWVDSQYKKSTTPDPKTKVIDKHQILMVVNIFNSGISEAGEIITSKNPKEFYTKIAASLKKQGLKSTTVYYHNMKFDITNIIDYFKSENVNFKVKSTLIVGTKYYKYDFFYKGILFSVVDSYNLTMEPLARFGKTFGLPKELWKSKFEFDFENLDTVNSLLQGCKELEIYGVQDVKTLKAGVEAFKKYAGCDRLTLAGTAFQNWLNFKSIELPELTEQEQIEGNYTYVGGMCTYNKDYADKTLDDDYIYIDANGLYSAAIYSTYREKRHPFPISKGILKNPKEDGNPDIFNIDKYYTIKARIKAVLKPKSTIGFIRLGKQCNCGVALSRFYRQNEYLERFEETIYINSIDLRLLHKYYYVDYIDYKHYWEYETQAGIFDEYIDFWVAKKTEGTLTGNEGLRSVAKYMLNSLTGKYGQMIDPVKTSIDFDDEKKILSYSRYNDNKPISFINMPIVSAILSYSREIMLDMMDSYPKEDFLYMDTDSNILTKSAYDNYINKDIIHKTKLGYFDIEHKIKKLKILRQKTYMFSEDVEEKGKIVEKTEVKCCGATDKVKKHINYDNFKLGLEIKEAVQLKPKTVPGGTALVKQPFVLREKFFS